MIWNRVTSSWELTNGRFSFSKRSIGQWLYLMIIAHCQRRATHKECSRW